MPYTAEEIGARVKERKPELSGFSDKEIGERVLQRHPELGQSVETPLISSHEKMGKSAPLFARSHEKTPTREFGPGEGKLQVPEIDPLTGRQKTRGRTMTEEETAKYRTGAMVLAGGTAGGLLGGAAVAGVPTAAAAVGESLGAGTVFAIQAAARTFGAALGGAAGEAYSQLFSHAHGVGPASSGEAATKIGTSGKDMAELEALGLTVEGALKVFSGGIRMVGSRLYEALKKTGVYEKMVAAKAAAITEKNLTIAHTTNQTAEEIANVFAPKPYSGLLETRGPGIVKAAEALVTKNVKTMYEGFKAVVTNQLVDYRDVADMIVTLEKSVPRAKGGLRVMTEPDTAWMEFVKAMEAGNKREAVQQVVSGKTMTVQAPARNSIEAAPAVVDARGTISQRIADLKRQPSASREYIEGLEKSLALLDTKLEVAATKVGPGGPELLNAAKGYFGASREIQKQAMYKVLKNGGDVAGALMDAGAPEGVAVVKAIARETGDRILVPTAQRAVIERLLDPTGKGVDMMRFGDRLGALGVTGEHLFSDPRASRIIAGLKEQADVLQRLEVTPRINGKGAERIAIELLTHAVGSVVGYQLGKGVTGSYHGGWVGVAIGASAANRAVGLALRLAENPAANKMFLNALKSIEKTGEVTGVAVTQTARAIRMVKNLEPIGEKPQQPAKEVQSAP